MYLAVALLNSPTYGDSRRSPPGSVRAAENGPDVQVVRARILTLAVLEADEIADLTLADLDRPDGITRRARRSRRPAVGVPGSWLGRMMSAFSRIFFMPACTGRDPSAPDGMSFSMLASSEDRVAGQHRPSVCGVNAVGRRPERVPADKQRVDSRRIS